MGMMDYIIPRKVLPEVFTVDDLSIHGIEVYCKHFNAKIAVWDLDNGGAGHYYRRVGLDYSIRFFPGCSDEQYFIANSEQEVKEGILRILNHSYNKRQCSITT